MRGARRICRRGTGYRPVVADHGTCRTGGRNQLLTRAAGPGGRLSDIGRDTAQGECHLGCCCRTCRSSQSRWADRTRKADRTRWPDRTRSTDRTHWPGRTRSTDRTHWPGRPGGAGRPDITLRTRYTRDARLALGTVGSGGAGRTQGTDFSLGSRRALRPLRTGRACRTDLTGRTRRAHGALGSDRARRPGRALLSAVPLRTTRQGDKTDETQSRDRNAHETSLAGAWHATFPAGQRKAKCGPGRIASCSLRAEKDRELRRRRDPLKHGEGLALYASANSRRTWTRTQD